MGIFNFFRKKPEQREYSYISVDDRLAKLLTLTEITPEQALNVPAFSASLDFVANKVAELPIKLFREKENGTVEEVKNDHRLRLLNDETEDLLDPYQMKLAVIRDFFVVGTGYIYPSWNRNTIQSLHYINANQVSYNISPNPIFKDAEYWIYDRRYSDDQLVRVCRNTKNGVHGISIIDEHNQILTTAYKAMLFEKHLLATGGAKKGFLSSEFNVTDQVVDKIRNDWRELYSDGSVPVVLNKGLKFNEFSSTSVEMQLQENKKINNELVCELFGLNTDVVSGKANDDVYTTAIKTAVVPIVTALQTAFNKGLLLPSERDSMYFVLDMTELLKGDMLKRYQAYQIGLENSFLQIDDVRYQEDLAPLGFNYIRLGLNDVLLNPVTKEIYTPNTNQTKTFGEKPTANLEKSADSDIIK